MSEIEIPEYEEEEPKVLEKKGNFDVPYKNMYFPDESALPMPVWKKGYFNSEKTFTIKGCKTKFHKKEFGRIGEHSFNIQYDSFGDASEIDGLDGYFLLELFHDVYFACQALNTINITKLAEEKGIPEPHFTGLAALVKSMEVDFSNSKFISFDYLTVGENTDLYMSVRNNPLGGTWFDLSYSDMYKTKIIGLAVENVAMKNSIANTA